MAKESKAVQKPEENEDLINILRYYLNQGYQKR
jgi:hypothetical protein